MGVNVGKSNLDIVRVLEICRDVELANAKLYYYFANIFNDDANLADLWLKTAREEENHAQQFVMGINLRKEPMVDSLLVDGSAAKDMLNYVNTLDAEARKNPPDKIESLRLALNLEEKLAAFHMATVANFAEPSHKKLFMAMMNTDDKHVEKLREMHRHLTAV